MTPDSVYSDIARNGPEFWMPEAERAEVEASYRAADVILEYGSGGSTRMAAELAGKHVISVETDRAWRDAVATFIERELPGAAVDVIHADIGPTVKFGYPKDWTRQKQFRAYPYVPWAAGRPAPDVVLIDGRFRIACFVATYLSIKKPTIVLWDDYADRWYYRVVEWLVRPVSMAGRIARFELQPNPPKRGLAKAISGSVGLFAG